jgi:hypothetical protein
MSNRWQAYGAAGAVIGIASMTALHNPFGGYVVRISCTRGCSFCG